MLIAARRIIKETQRDMPTSAPALWGSLSRRDLGMSEKEEETLWQRAWLFVLFQGKSLHQEDRLISLIWYAVHAKEQIQRDSGTMYQDHLTKFCVLWQTKSKRPAEVAAQLMDIFPLLGSPVILQSDNGTEFTAHVISEIKGLLACFGYSSWQNPSSAKSRISWTITWWHQIHFGDLAWW